MPVKKFLLQLSKFKNKSRLIWGDILHIEPLSKQHDEKFSFTRQYYENKLNELVIQVEEGNNTFKKRITNEASISNGNQLQK